jgi:hypothetical protein
MKARNTDKKVLKKVASSAIIPVRKVAGLVMQGLKTFWNNWNWVLPVVALLLSVFTWYYKTTTVNPARIASCEEKLAKHIEEADTRLKKIETDYNEVKLTLAEINAKMTISLQDLAIMKGYITGEAHRK